jgi:hypothetical protein
LASGLLAEERTSLGKHTIFWIFGYGAKPPDQRFFSKGDIMMKNALLPLAVGLILGSAVWGVKAAPLSGLSSATSQNQSPIEKIGCSRSSSNETCPYGYQPRGYGSRRYRDYDHGYYGPKKYPREYY